MCQSRCPALKSQLTAVKRAQRFASFRMSQSQLVTVADCANSNGSSLHDHSKNGQAACKKVRFADTEGFDLVRVRDIPQGNLETPPDIHAALVRTYQSCTSTGCDGASSDIAANNEDEFIMDFQQPVSDILSFMRRVEQDQVCLESAQVTDGKLIGNVKVKNLAFHKTVFVRLSADNWRTIQNIEAHYVDIAEGKTAARSASPHHNLMDTFSFLCDLTTCSQSQQTTSARSKSIQFAVCFRCQGSEFWDNNRGKNYQIIVHNERISTPPGDQSSSNTREMKTSNFTTDGFNVSWSEYAIWNHIDDLTPYW